MEQHTVDIQAKYFFEKRYDVIQRAVQLLDSLYQKANGRPIDWTNPNVRIQFAVLTEEKTDVQSAG